MNFRASIESVLVRGISIFSKFVLVTLLVHLLDLSDFGSYQLISYFVIISVYVFGLEFYMLSNRLVALKFDKSTLNDHASFFINLLPITLLFQLVGIFVLIPNLTDQWLIFLISFIGLSEYFSQEIFRYLIMLEKVSKANSILIFRSLTLLLLVFLLNYFKQRIDLNDVIGLYALSHFILLVVCVCYFKKFVLKGGGITVRILGRRELLKIFKQLYPFLLLMIFTKGIEYSDKYLLGIFHTTADVGIYSYLYSVSWLINVFVVSGLYLIHLPILIRATGSKIDFKKKFKEFSILVLISSVVLCALIVIFIDPLLQLVDKSELIENVFLLYVFLCAFFLANLALIPQILIYAYKHDKTLLGVGFWSFGFNLIANVFLIKSLGIWGGAISLIISYLVKMSLSTYYAIKIWKE